MSLALVLLNLRVSLRCSFKLASRVNSRTCFSSSLFLISNVAYLVLASAILISKASLCLPAASRAASSSVLFLRSASSIFFSASSLAEYAPSNFVLISAMLSLTFCSISLVTKSLSAASSLANGSTGGSSFFLLGSGLLGSGLFGSGSAGSLAPLGSLGSLIAGIISPIGYKPVIDAVQQRVQPIP